VVYVDNDPIVLVLARALLTSVAGTIAYVDADARDIKTILHEAAHTLDFSEPVTVMFLMILQYIPTRTIHGGSSVRSWTRRRRVAISSIRSPPWMSARMPTSPPPPTA
jgi:hypothetical protein